MTYAKLLFVGLGANWRRLWAADAISSLGDGAYAAAVPLLAVYFTHSPAQVAGVATAASLPWLLCSLHAGALADRYDRRRLMSIAQVVQALAVSIAAVTAIVPGGRIWMLYLTSFALGAAETVFANSAQSMLPAVVGPAQLEAANGRQYATETVTQQFIGPPLGSLLFAAALPATRSLPFWLDALTFALSAFLIARIYLPRPTGAAALAGTVPASAADTAAPVGTAGARRAESGPPSDAARHRRGAAVARRPSAASYARDPARGHEHGRPDRELDIRAVRDRTPARRPPRVWHPARRERDRWRGRRPREPSHRRAPRHAPLDHPRSCHRRGQRRRGRRPGPGRVRHGRLHGGECVLGDRMERGNGIDAATNHSGSHSGAR